MAVESLRRIHPDFTEDSSPLHLPRVNKVPMEHKKTSGTNWFMTLGLAVIGVALGAAGIYIGDTDDAPGAALIGIVLMVTMVVFAVKTARRKPVERL